MRLINKLLFFISAILLSSCATLKMQVSKDENTDSRKIDSKIAHSFYLIGDAGNSDLIDCSPALQYLEKYIVTADKNATLLFLGDNVYEKGIPVETSKKYSLAKHRIEVQTDVAKKFAGRTIFIPGNHDWYKGLEGLKRQELLVEKALGENTFLPKNGCPLKKVTISKEVNLIIIDSHWYITQSNKNPNSNKKCEIKTRKKFLEKLNDFLNNSKEKTTIVAMHHPLFTKGSHGGKFSFASHLIPLPILGTLKNVFRETSGITNTDLSNKNYKSFKEDIIQIAQKNHKIIFVSGHEHSLQFIVEKNIPQIISGSGSKITATKLSGGAKFTYGTQGFAKLDIYKNGITKVCFYTVKDNEIVYETVVLKSSEKR